MRSRWVLVTALSLSFPHAFAEPLTLAPVIVTASRFPQAVDESLAPVTIITRAEIERSQAVDVAELLRFHAGLEIARNGGPGQPASLFIRGTESNHALVMIDGVRINPGTLGGAALQHIRPELIERVEVVRGPLSTLYGSGAIGGVVNIITKRAEGGLQAQAGAEVGSFDTRHWNAALQGSGARGRAGLAISRFDTEGFPTREGSDIDRGYDTSSLNAYAGTSLGPLDAEASHWQVQGKVEYLGESLEPLDYDFRNHVSALTLKAKPWELWTATVRLSRMIDEIDQNQSTDFAHTQRNVLDWQNDIGLGDHHVVTAGLVLSREHTESLIFGRGFDEDTEENALYLQDTLEYGDHRAQLAWRTIDHDSFGRHDTWNLAYGYQVSPRTRLLASAGTAFRAPDATDRFGFGGDPNLDPETSRSAELGLRHQIDQHQTLALNAFLNRIDDLILFTATETEPLGRVENIGRARIRGLEAEYEGHWGPWDARLSALIQDPRNLDTNELLPRRARRSLTASVAYTTERYAVGADLLVQSRRKDSNFSDASNSGYGLINATAQVNLSRRWTVQGRIENLLDKDYQLAAGFNTPGRSYFVGLRYALR